MFEPLQPRTSFQLATHKGARVGRRDATLDSQHTRAAALTELAIGRQFLLTSCRVDEQSKGFDQLRISQHKVHGVELSAQHTRFAW